MGKSGVKLIPKRKLFMGEISMMSEHIEHITIEDYPGITKLSELEIDCNKDWEEKYITQLAGFASGHQRGDVFFIGIDALSNLIVKKLPPDQAGMVLVCKGVGHDPEWDWVWGEPGASTGLDRAWSAVIDLLLGVQTVQIAKAQEETAAITSEHKQSCGDAPTDFIKSLTPAIALVDAEAAITPDQTHNEDVAIGREAGVQLLVDGAVADDGGATTDETTEAREATTDDMTLLPSTPAVNDAYYFGFDRTFDRVWLNISTAGSGNWGFAHEYWDGDSWEALSGVVDDTDEFSTSGLNKIQFTRPGDWATTDVGGVVTKYWIRARVSSYTSIATQPLGAQAWCEVLV